MTYSCCPGKLLSVQELNGKKAGCTSYRAASLLSCQLEQERERKIEIERERERERRDITVVEEAGLSFLQPAWLPDGCSGPAEASPGSTVAVPHGWSC